MGFELAGVVAWEGKSVASGVGGDASRERDVVSGHLRQTRVIHVPYNIIISGNRLRIPTCSLGCYEKLSNIESSEG